MAITHDIYAETNPAYCAALLKHFVTGYLSFGTSAPDITLCYAALPVALSGDLASTFDRTNRSTGLLEWLHRSAVIQIRLADRINGSLEIVTEAIQFACFSQLLALNPEGRVVHGASSMPRHLTAQLSEDTQQIFKKIHRLGYWFASAGTTRTVFDMMGLKL